MTTRGTTHRTFVVGDEGDGADDEDGGSGRTIAALVVPARPSSRATTDVRSRRRV